MKYTFAPAGLSAIFFALLFACGCDGQFFPSRKATRKAETNAPPPKVEVYRDARNIDGSAADWPDPPLWEEAGEEVEDPGFSIDIKQVHVTNDRKHLYIFMRSIPSVIERFKKQPFPGRFGDLYIDVDNNRTTGSTDAELETFGYGNGYEVKISIEVGIAIDAQTNKTPFVSYTVRKLDREGLVAALQKISEVMEANDPVMRQIVRRLFLWKDVEGGFQVSNREDARIAHGDDGVELAMPMELLGIEPGTAVRVMLAEEARDFSMEGYGVRYHTLR